jgi:hypothetical protein
MEDLDRGLGLDFQKELIMKHSSLFRSRRVSKGKGPFDISSGRPYNRGNATARFFSTAALTVSAASGQSDQQESFETL